MIFRRLISNLVDFLIFIILAIVLIKSTNSLNNVDAVRYFYFVTFILVFVIPIMTMGNTFGKKILQLRWELSDTLKIRLITKYLLYYITFISSISFVELINDAPFLNNGLFQIDKMFQFRLLVSIIITDVIAFTLSLGKYHIIDYILNIQIASSLFKKSHSKLLGISFLLGSLIILSGIFTHKINFDTATLNQLVNDQLFFENYPKDFVNSKYCFTTKKRSAYLVCPSKPMSFMNSVELKQKTIYLNVPANVFNEESERYSLCEEVLKQSWTNDIYANYEPDQIRLILYNSEPGFFYEYYINHYIYYYDNNIPQWGIYAGIQADSITAENYLDFTNTYINSVNDKINRYETILNNDYSKKLNLDSANNLLNEELSQTYYFTTTNESVIITVDSSSLELNRVDFSDAELMGYFGFNFPFQSMDKRALIDMFSNNEIVEMDFNLDYLIYIRNETTNKVF